MCFLWFVFFKNTLLRVEFSTLFSMFGNVVEHGLSCLTYYLKFWLSRFFFHGPSAYRDPAYVCTVLQKKNPAHKLSGLDHKFSSLKSSYNCVLWICSKNSKNGIFCKRDLSESRFSFGCSANSAHYFNVNHGIRYPWIVSRWGRAHFQDE